MPREYTLPEGEFDRSYYQTPSRPGKRKRTPSGGPSTAMDVVGDETGSDSNSSDWGDWADAMVAQGEPANPGAPGAGSGGARGDGSAETGDDAEEEAWMKAMIDQGTECSVVQESDSRGWEYAMQLAVEAEQQVSAFETHVDGHGGLDRSILEHQMICFLFADFAAPSARSSRSGSVSHS